MMRINIFYFSGTGNTLWAVETLCEYLHEHHVDAICISIESLDRNDLGILIKEADAIGLAWPIYGSDMPENMKELINDLPHGDGKPLLTLCTQYAFSGDGAYVMHREIKKKGYVYRWCFQLNTPSNINIYPIYYKSSDDYAFHEKSRLNKARAKLKYLASKIAQDTPYVRGSTFFHTMAAMLLRPAFRLGHKYFIKKGWLQATKDKCTGCGICSLNCPVDNIKIVDGLPEFGQQCLFCLRCYDFCPTTAITGKGHEHNSKFGPPFRGPNKEIYQRIMRNHKA